MNAGDTPNKRAMARARRQAVPMALALVGDAALRERMRESRRARDAEDALHALLHAARGDHDYRATGKPSANLAALAKDLCKRLSEVACPGQDGDSLLARAGQNLDAADWADRAARDEDLERVLHVVASSGEGDQVALLASQTARLIASRRRMRGVLEVARNWEVGRLAELQPVSEALSIVAGLSALPDPEAACRRKLIERVRNPAAGVRTRYLRQPSEGVVRDPAVLGLVTKCELELCEGGDGLPTSRLPRYRPLRRRHPDPRVRRGRQPDLFPVPRTLNGLDVEGVVIQSAEALRSGERHPLMADIQRVCLFAYATQPCTFTEEEGVLLITGRRTTTDGALRRWWDALRTARRMDVVVDPRKGRFLDLLQVTINGDLRTASLAAPSWWQGRGDMNAWRLTGALHRRPQIGGDGWATLSRTLNGLEAALCYTPSAGRGHGGRTPGALVPVHSGGPGQEYRIHWQDVLRLSGEPFDEKASYRNGRDGRRYRRRLEALEHARYMCEGSRAAHAGDTIEITCVERGANGGIRVRATARFCDAAANAASPARWRHVPAAHLLEQLDADG